MRLILVLLVFAAFLVGCSNYSNPLDPGIRPGREIGENSSNQWNWGFWQMQVSADHTQIEKIPVRGGDFHYGVTRFLEEGPCFDCLNISQPQVQGDGSIILNVTLRHPFPGAPKFTGFDVRGMVYFPVTTDQTTEYGATGLEYRTNLNQHTPAALFYSMPLKYSRAVDGGGELLNADGYSCYLIPGLEYSDTYPIFSYRPGLQSIEPTPQTTVTPYRLFASELTRRMFYVFDEITLPYHIALPEGSFTFGYAVDASWWPPDTQPVINPGDDFPRYANAEDPWQIDFKQTAPISAENVGKDIFDIKVYHRGYDSTSWYAMIFCSDLAVPGYYPAFDPQFQDAINTPIDEFTSSGVMNFSYAWWMFHDYGALAPSGKYFAILIVQNTQPNQENPKTELQFVFGAKFIEIEVE